METLPRAADALGECRLRPQRLPRPTAPASLSQHSRPSLPPAGPSPGSLHSPSTFYTQPPRQALRVPGPLQPPWPHPHIPAMLPLFFVRPARGKPALPVPQRGASWALEGNRLPFTLYPVTAQLSQSEQLVPWATVIGLGWSYDTSMANELPPQESFGWDHWENRSLQGAGIAEAWNCPPPAGD